MWIRTGFEQLSPVAQSIKGFGFEPLDRRFESHRLLGIFQYVLFRTLHFGEKLSQQDKKFVRKKFVGGGCPWS
jgi:hypothetical protein